MRSNKSFLWIYCCSRVVVVLPDGVRVHRKLQFRKQNERSMRISRNNIRKLKYLTMVAHAQWPPTRRKTAHFIHIWFMHEKCAKTKTSANKQEPIFIRGFIQPFRFAFDRCVDDDTHTHTQIQNVHIHNVNGCVYCFSSWMCKSKAGPGKACHHATVMHRYSKQTCITFCTW